MGYSGLTGVYHLAIMQRMNTQKQTPQRVHNQNQNQVHRQVHRQVNRQDTTLQTNLLSLSETPAGFSASEVTGYSPEIVRRTANALVTDGRMIRAKVGGRSLRYFANQQLIEACMAGNREAQRARPLAGPRSKARWSADEPAIITPQTKIYIAPPLPRRVLRTNTYTQF